MEIEAELSAVDKVIDTFCERGVSGLEMLHWFRLAIAERATEREVEGSKRSRSAKAAKALKLSKCAYYKWIKL